MFKKFTLIFLSLFIATVFFAGCDKDNPTEPKDENLEFDMVEAVGNTYFTAYTTAAGAVNISIATVFTNLTDGNTSNDPFIIDWRSAADFATGHLKGAVNMSIKDLVAKVEDGTIPKTKTILNVCYTGQTASHATAVLNMLGYTAQNLTFGMCGVTTADSINGTKNWVNQIAADEYADQLVATKETLTKEYAFPKVATGKSTVDEIIKARYKEYIAKFTSWPSISAKDVFTDPTKYFIVNYWPEAEYLNPGHIPGAFQFTPNQSLKKDAQLKNLPTDKKIVIYCYSGQTSAQVAAYLQLLGYDAYSLLYGVNGFAYNKLTKSKYVAPTGDYSSVVTEK
ncbi:rhodanese-like domain-containing protein [candidate division KSB1 bacterium]|nr:rhodanese-like domain-containing protein [candidate division KSB1 bacterium]